MAELRDVKAVRSLDLRGLRDEGVQELRGTGGKLLGYLAFDDDFNDVLLVAGSVTLDHHSNGPVICWPTGDRSP